MANDFKKILQVFETFDKHTDTIVEKCKEFSQIAMDAGALVGAGAGFLADSYAAKNKNKENSGLFTLVGALAGRALGAVVGNINENKQLQKEKENIYNYVVKDRNAYLDYLSDSVDFSAKQIDDIENLIDGIRNKIVKNINYDESDEGVVDYVKDFIVQNFKNYYINARAANIHNFYLNFEKSLDEDVVNFGENARKETYVDRVESYCTAYNQIYNSLIENQSEEVVKKIDYVFECVAAKVPVYTVDYDWANLAASESLMSDAKYYFANTLNKKKKENVVIDKPLFYYKSYGYENYFNAAALSYLQGSRRGSHNAKLRSVLIGLIPAIISAIYIVFLNNFINIPYGNFLIYPISIFAMEIPLGLIKLSQRKHADYYFDYEWCEIINEECLENEFKRNVDFKIDYTISENQAIDSNSEEPAALPDATTDEGLDELMKMQKELEQSEKGE
ncbi:MAG: hypothetical protein MJ169_07240 [Treponema sp.]|nr:hypothetical protein [Treponema sp.]